jgi:sulfur-oxidizing protein SoxY
MRSTLRSAARGLAPFALLLAGATQAFAGSWDEIRNSVYGTRAIEDGHGVVTLEAPNRPEDMRTVPISATAGFKDGRTVKSVSFLIDENPTPVVAVFHMGGARETVWLKSNFRVDRQSDVRAIVEASDGKLYMVSQLIKFAGGQSSCSAPPAGDPAEIIANMGKMNLSELPGDEKVSSATARARIDLNHPNHTGMVMDQITLLYTPMKMVSEVTVRQGDEDIFRAEGSIAFSQNPQIEFDFKRNGAETAEVTMKDTDGGTWTKSFPLAPKS